KKTNRDCTYDYSASSKRGRPKNDYELLQEQIEDLQTSTFQQVDRMESMLVELSGVPQGNAPDTNLLMTNGNNIYNNNYTNSNNNDNVNDNNNMNVSIVEHGSLACRSLLTYSGL